MGRLELTLTGYNKCIFAKSPKSSCKNFYTLEWDGRFEIGTKLIAHSQPTLVNKLKDQTIKELQGLCTNLEIVIPPMAP